MASSRFPMLRRFERSLHDPRPAQEEAFARLVSGIGGSRMGERSGLCRMTRTEQARSLPSLDHESLRSELALARDQGGAGTGIFGRSPLVAFAQTSGTTAEPKRLPVTLEFLRSYRRANRLMAHCYFADTGFWGDAVMGYNLLLAARPFVERGPGGLEEGFMSGLMAARLPWWMKRTMLPGSRLLNLPSWDEKMDLILDRARDRDVRRIAGVPPLVLSVCERAIERFGVSSLRETWPGLRTVFSGGLALGDQLRRRFTRLLGRDDLVFWDMYAATEGQFGHTYRRDWPGLVFNAFENFFQFQERPGSELLQLHEIEAGGRYLIHVTTPGGLVNYRMGDWIEVLSTRPLTFRVAGREKDELSLAGEKIVADQLECSLDRVRERHGAEIREWGLWGEAGSPNRLVVAVDRESLEESGVPSGRLASWIDEALGVVNPTYGEMRRNDFLYGKLEVHAIPGVRFREYRSRNLDRGQFKGRRIFQGREEFEAVLGRGARHPAIEADRREELFEGVD